jgi:hypothetical protein
MRQAIEMPIGVNNGKVYSRDIWSPGAVTQGIEKDAFTPLITHNGVTQSEFQMFDLISRKIDEFVGPLSLGTTANTGTPSASQIIEETKRSLKALGLCIFAASRLKRDMSYLRLWTVFEEYFTMNNAPMSFTINEADLGKGVTGKKILKLSNKNLSDTELKSIFDAEEQSEKDGMPFRLRQINVDVLKEYPLFWYIEVASQERENGALDKAMFQDKMNQGTLVAQVTGRQMNPDTLIESFERTWKSKGLFERNSAGPQGMPGMPGATGQPADAGAMMPGTPAQGGDVKGQAQELLSKLGSMQQGAGTPGQGAPAPSGKSVTSTKLSPQPPGRPTLASKLAS